MDGVIQDNRLTENLLEMQIVATEDKLHVNYSSAAVDKDKKSHVAVDETPKTRHVFGPCPMD